VGTVGEQWWNYGGTVGTAAALWGKGVLGGGEGGQTIDGSLQRNALLNSQTLFFTNANSIYIQTA
jgi:hypothetical protein